MLLELISIEFDAKFCRMLLEKQFCRTCKCYKCMCTIYAEPVMKNNMFKKSRACMSLCILFIEELHLESHQLNRI